MNNKTLSLTVNDLKLDLKNPRFNGIEFQNENEAIKQLFSLFNNSRFLNLAEDIIASGLNPSETFLILKDTKDPKKYIVLEGNRRLTCLILLSDPKRAPSPYIQEKIELILAKYPDTPPQKIKVLCSLMSSREEADKWIDLKHADSNKKGLKTEEWPSNTRALRGSSKNKPELYFQLTEILHQDNTIPSLIQHIISALPRTNITRLFGFSAVRTLLNYTITNGVIELPSDENTRKETLKNISQVLLHIYSKKLNVSNFKNAQLAEKLVRDIMQKNTIELDDDTFIVDSEFQELELDFKDEASEQLKIGIDHANTINLDSTSKFEKDEVKDEVDEKTSHNENEGKYQKTKIQNDVTNDPEDNHSDTEANQSFNSKSVRTAPSYKNQKVLLNYKLNIPVDKVNQVYRELKKLSLDEYLYSISIVFRAFLEFSCDWYIFQQPQHVIKYRLPKESTDKSINEKSKLADKIKGIAYHFQKKGLLNSKQVESINTITNSNGVGTISWLHSCIHNYTNLITKEEVLTTHNNLRPFLEAIWNKRDETVAKLT